MPDVSFLLYTHSRRIHNISQMLYFLTKHEPDLMARCEIIALCQDHSRFSGSSKHMRVVQLGEEKFNKPLMVNRSIQEAAADKVAMLDGDRILPPGYFTRAFESLKKGEIITTRPLYRLKRTYSIFEIEEGLVEKTPDWRDMELVPGKKNAFSGNTVMWKQDFLDMGGMDESYVNYGCADLDASTSALKHGLKTTYLDEEELHLWHPFDMPQDVFQTINAHSAVKYCQKWNKPLPAYFHQLLRTHNHLCLMS